MVMKTTWPLTRVQNRSTVHPVCICLFKVFSFRQEWSISHLFSSVCGMSCFFYLSPQEENEGVHSNRLYHGSVMINRTNSTLTLLSISRDSITALWDVFAWTDRLVLLTPCVFICNVTENAAVISADQTVCLCASQTDNVCQRKPLMCPQCVCCVFNLPTSHTQLHLFKINQYVFRKRCIIQLVTSAKRDTEQTCFSNLI